MMRWPSAAPLWIVLQLISIRMMHIAADPASMDSFAAAMNNASAIAAKRGKPEGDFRMGIRRVHMEGQVFHVALPVGIGVSVLMGTCSAGKGPRVYMTESKDLCAKYYLCGNGRVIHCSSPRV